MLSQTHHHDADQASSCPCLCHACLSCLGLQHCETAAAAVDQAGEMGRPELEAGVVLWLCLGRLLLPLAHVVAAGLCACSKSHAPGVMQHHG